MQQAATKVTIGERVWRGFAISILVFAVAMFAFIEIRSWNLQERLWARDVAEFHGTFDPVELGHVFHRMQHAPRESIANLSGIRFVIADRGRDRHGRYVMVRQCHGGDAGRVYEGNVTFLHAIGVDGVIWPNNPVFAGHQIACESQAMARRSLGPEGWPYW